MGIFLISLILMVLILFVGMIVYLMRDTAKSVSPRCPTCNERVEPKDEKCGHCGRDLKAREAE